MFSNLVPVYFNGKRYDVPDSFTIMRAYEYAGHQYIRGCGCKGGVCGACAALYMIPGSLKLHTGLACQTQVISGMSVVQLPYFPTDTQGYELEVLSPTIESVGMIYPKIYKCLACNTCTKMCPQGIDVMGCISAALRGDLARVADESRPCVMCGLCTSRCPAEIGQYNIMLLCRRLFGRYLQKPYRYLPARVGQIEEGQFVKELEELMNLDLDQLQAKYRRQQEDKRII